MKRLIFTLLLVPLFWTCKKDPPLSYCEEFPNDCVDVREVKDYFYFNYGSWWVYVEENSGKRDSVYVTETSNDTGSVLFSTEVFSSYDEHYSRFWANGVDPHVKNNIAHKSERSTSVNRSKWKSGGGGYIGESKCFLFYPVPGLWTYSYGGAYVSNNILKVEDVLSTITVLDKIFYQVVSISEEHTIVEHSQQTNHYYSPDIGLIKKELLDSNQIWNLIDYQIVK